MAKKTDPAQQHRGIKEDWLNLPRRRCDNCGGSYKPKHPKQRFCKDQCRFQFSRNGSAILQLKERIAPEVDIRYLLSSFQSTRPMARTCLLIS
jgi:hypothetical protein